MWTEFTGLQLEHSLIQRTPGRELLPMARPLDIGVTAWSPLGNGLLTGKYNKKRSTATTTAAAATRQIIVIINFGRRQELAKYV